MAVEYSETFAYFREQGNLFRQHLGTDVSTLPTYNVLCSEDSSDLQGNVSLISVSAVADELG
jgi:hypothetical protein